MGLLRLDAGAAQDAGEVAERPAAVRVRVQDREPLDDVPGERPLLGSQDGEDVGERVALFAALDGAQGGDAVAQGLGPVGDFDGRLVVWRLMQCMQSELWVGTPVPEAKVPAYGSEGCRFESCRVLSRPEAPDDESGVSGVGPYSSEARRHCP
ncbi:hypothetical protein P3L51_15250 [Streptomyces sp. PSRA5]|uniref:hypothetical protein n=1 Tax=Streptomyces panacea TaxID=3035064 RepID=UPI00339BCF75